MSPRSATELNDSPDGDSPLETLYHGINNPPHPSALLGAMRSIGYTPPTAIADLVDNSISAGATRISLLVEPSRDHTHSGYVVVEDDGSGMEYDALAKAMRWGGDGPTAPRNPSDLGRFGLGLKTASLSMGQILTVATRSTAGQPLSILSWDMSHVAVAGWQMLRGARGDAEQLVASSRLGTDSSARGTVVVITRLDKLVTGSGLAAHTTAAAASVTRKVAAHLGMVFHEFIADGVDIRLGDSAVPAWDPFEEAHQCTRELLGTAVQVTSYLLPHPSRTNTDLHRRLGGPRGWSAHQGFLVYRARRLIVPGGWLRLFRPEEMYRLARIRVDLPTSTDAGWNLNIMKSSVSPPSVLSAELTRIGEAARRQAKEVFGFRGRRQAPDGDTGAVDRRSFWHQELDSDSVRFRINRAHPVIQALKQSVADPKLAEPFLRAFERLLPLDAILQDPKRTTNGAVDPIDAEEIEALAALANRGLSVLLQQGVARDKAFSIILGAEPFVRSAEAIRPLLR